MVLKMLKRTCDRCCKTITEGPMARDLSDNMGILTLEIGPFQKVQRYIGGIKTNGYECLNERMTCDLCTECVESFKKWIAEEKPNESSYMRSLWKGNRRSQKRKKRIHLEKDQL